MCGYFTYSCPTCHNELELPRTRMMLQQYCEVCDAPLDIGSVITAAEDEAAEQSVQGDRE